MFNWLWGNKLVKIPSKVNLSYEIGQFPIFEEVEKDISEPVLAIVECMKKYPSRFKLDNLETKSDVYSWSKEWTVSDVKTGQVIKVTHECNMYSRHGLESSWKWLTEDELALLKDTFQGIGKIKTQRMYSIQRAKMKGVYK